MLKTFTVPAMCVAIQGVFYLCASGCATDIIMNSGYCVSPQFLIRFHSTPPVVTSDADPPRVKALFRHQGNGMNSRDVATHTVPISPPPQRGRFVLSCLCPRISEYSGGLEDSISLCPLHFASFRQTDPQSLLHLPVRRLFALVELREQSATHGSDARRYGCDFSHVLQTSLSFLGRVPTSEHRQ